MKLDRLLGTLSILLIGAFYYIKFSDSLDPFFQGQSTHETLFIILALFFVISYSFTTTKIALKGRFTYAFIIYFVWLWLSSVFATLHHPFGSMNLVGLLFLPLLSFMLMYKTAFTITDKSKKILVLTIVIFVVFLSIQYMTNRASLLSIITQSTQASGGAYFPVVLLPFVLLIPNNVLKYSLAILLAVVSLFSAKRGGAIAVGVAILSCLFMDFFVSSQNANKKKRFKFLLVILAICIIGAYYAPQLLSDETTELAERFEEGDYANSSRSFIYGKVIRMIFSSNLFYMFFGHGWDAVLSDGNMGYSAHNDFLESFYDFGFLGFLFYLYLHLQLFKESHRLIKMHSTYAGPFLASWLMFLVFGSVSHIILYPPMTIAFAMFWGFVKGNVESQKRKLISDNQNVVSKCV